MTLRSRASITKTHSQFYTESSFPILREIRRWFYCEILRGPRDARARARDVYIYTHTFMLREKLKNVVSALSSIPRAFVVYTVYSVYTASFLRYVHCILSIFQHRIPDNSRELFLKDPSIYIVLYIHSFRNKLFNKAKNNPENILYSPNKVLQFLN